MSIMFMFLNHLKPVFLNYITDWYNYDNERIFICHIKADAWGTYNLNFFIFPHSLELLLYSYLSIIYSEQKINKF